MTCQEFRDKVHEYLDGTLEPAVQAAAREHAERCPECRLMLQGMQTLGRALQHALDHATARVSLPPETSQRIMRAARPQVPGRPAVIRGWQWLAASPFRALGAGATLLGLLLLSLQFRHPGTDRSGAQTLLRTDRASYFVDVPFRTEVHVFQLRNGMVIDAVLTRVAEIHAGFSKPQKSSSPSP